MTVDDLQRVLPDRYRVLHEIGRGGMATVYLAEDTEAGREVAIKVMAGELGSSLDAARFTREIRIAGELIHPNILQAYDSGSAPGIVFYVMPFIRGRSVRARLDDEKQLPVEEAVRITCEVCDALAFAHERGVVHRDIKPENILLDDGRAIVADFGIARVIAEQGATLTQTGLSLGTAQYMSPEQAAAEKVDGRSDIYSVGCVLYEMLVGEPPFTGPNAMAVLARSVTQPVPSIRVVRSIVPEAVEFAVMRALEKTPVDRFKSISEFKEALLLADDSAQLTKQRKAYTPGYTATYRNAPPPAWRQPRALAAIAATFVILAAGTGWMIYRSAHARDLAAVAVSKAKRVAVLYFGDASPNGSLRYIADGLTESLIDELGLVQTLDVASRNAVRPLRGSQAPADSVARALNVGTIVRGDVAPGSKGARVTVRLLDGQSGAELKNATFDVDTANVLAARSDVTNRVAEFLRSEMGLTVQLKESRLGTTNAQAWVQFQRGGKQLKDADSLISARDTQHALAALDSADHLLGSASSLDGSWVDPVIARAGVRRSHARLVRDQPNIAKSLLDSADVFANRALAVAPRSADAHEMRGSIALTNVQLRTVPEGAAYDAMLDRAEKELTDAVQINPGQASAFELLSLVEYAQKRVPEALQSLRSAYAADAYLLNARNIVNGLFWGFYDTENFPEANRWCAEGRSRYPRAIPFVQCSLYLMMAKGGHPDPAEAWRLADTIRTLSAPATRDYEDHLARTLVGGVLGKTGLADSANHVIVAARAGTDIDPGQEIIGREIMMRLMYGDFDTAIARLGDYLAIHPDHRKGLANQTAWYWRDPRVQNDPRFRRLIAGAR